jgi:hypothetical protein
MTRAGTTNGPLGGLGILRFAHAFESGGGTERYLDDLDHALLERHAMPIVRIHLTRNHPAGAPAVEPVGQGRLVRVPLPVLRVDDLLSSPKVHSFRLWLKQ